MGFILALCIDYLIDTAVILALKRGGARLLSVANPSILDLPAVYIACESMVTAIKKGFHPVHVIC